MAFLCGLADVQDAQQQRLCTQEASILQMKQELLRASMAQDEHVNKNVWRGNRLVLDCHRSKRIFSIFTTALEKASVSFALKMCDRRSCSGSWRSATGSGESARYHAGPSPSLLHQSQ